MPSLDVCRPFRSITYVVTVALHRRRWPARPVRGHRPALEDGLYGSATAASGWRWRWPASAAGWPAASTCRRHAVVFCSNHESNVDPPVLFEALHPRLTILYKAELRQVSDHGTVFDVGGFVPVDRGDREQAMASICAGGRRRCGGQFVPDLSRGHPQPHRTPAAVQEGRLHHGHPGAGADRAGGDPGRTRRDAEGQRDSCGRSTSACGSARPIPTAGLTIDDRDALIAQVRGEVQKLLDEGPLWT